MGDLNAAQSMTLHSNSIPRAPESSPSAAHLPPALPPEDVRASSACTAMPKKAATPELSHALWPAGASLLSSFLLIDAIALSAYGLHRFVRHRTRLNQSGQVARTRFHCDSACIVALLVASGFATFGGFVVAWHDDTNLALNSLGCDHPIYLNAVLATALALQAVLFGALSAFLLSKTLQRFRVTLTLQRRILKGRLASTKGKATPLVRRW